MTPKTAKFCGQKSGNECQNKKSFPESILTRTFCKKRDPNWPFLASTAPFTIYHPHIGGYHHVLYFTTQMTEKYSTAMCYLSIIERCSILHPTSTPSHPSHTQTHPSIAPRRYLHLRCCFLTELPTENVQWFE